MEEISMSATNAPARLSKRFAPVEAKLLIWRSIRLLMKLASRFKPLASVSLLCLERANERLGGKLEPVEAYEQALKQFPRSPQLHYAHGSTLLNKKRWKAAEDALRTAMAMHKHPPGKYYAQLAYALERQNFLTWQQVDLLEKAVAISPRQPYWNFRLGVVREQMGQLDAAIESYRHALAIRPEPAQWHYRLGYALEQAGRREEASASYSEAIRLATDKRATALGIGVFHQRRGLWKAAARAYRDTVEKDPANAAASFSCGYALDRCYEWKKAENCFRRALELDKTHAEWFYRLGFVLERQQKWQNAATAYSDALARKNEFASSWFYRLAYVLEEAGEFEKARATYRESRILKSAHGVSERRFNKDRAFRERISYLQYIEDYPVRDNVVLYESYGGISMGCNPNAIFEGLLKRDEYEELIHVWVINDPDRIPAYLRGRDDTIFTRKNSDLYVRHLATAKYLINNGTFPQYFVRRPNQRYLNTWHGTPLKTLGIDIKTDPMQRSNTARNLLHATHLISPNAHTTQVMLGRYGIGRTFQGKMAETGYPRIDRLVNSTEEQRRRIKKRLNIDPEKPVVLYAPTFRGYFHEPAIESEMLIHDVKSLSANLNIELLFRGHYHTEKALGSLEIPVNVVPQSLDTCELLSIVDILVTDYSSILFDFLPTHRPIFFYIHDLESYRENRGLYFSFDELPGLVCRDLSSLHDGLRQVTSATVIEHPRMAAALERFSLHEDGKATDRAIEFFFEDADMVDADHPEAIPILIFGGGFIPNGITSSLKNLVSTLAYAGYQITIAVDGAAIRGREEREHQLAQLPAAVDVVIRSGARLLTPEEDLAAADYHRRGRLESDEQRDIVMRAYRREYRRIFGDTRFLVQIDFTGYQLFWATLFAFGGNTKRIMYLHSNMYCEWKARYPYLKGIFRLYPHYDRVVSVSESVHRENLASLTPAFNIPPEKFVCVHNTIGRDRILTLAKDQPVGAPPELLDSRGPKFVTTGRLSVEKRHDKLLAAFQHFRADNSSAKLFIIGEGVLREDLTLKIRSAGLETAVFLLGYRVNPYALMARADCFVLSSDHEGQPMVLLEALALGIPTLSTDVPGSRSVLEGGYGLLVENSVDGLVSGMQKIAKRDIAFKSFNIDQYQKDAVTMFRERVLDEHPRSARESQGFGYSH
jgi:CDP-glycerol glycerophosphotransferase